MHETVPESYPVVRFYFEWIIYDVFVANVFRPLTLFAFKGITRASRLLYPWSWRLLSSFETSSATQQTTRHHITEELNPRRCKRIYRRKFKVCRSVHHRTIQINHQPDATIFQFIILTFIYSSTCFGRFPAHHQELNDCSGNLWFYLRIVVIVVPCSWSDRPTTNTARLSPRYEGKTRGCHCSHWALDDGRESARNMLSCK